jgi:hypothetical protein
MTAHHTTDENLDQRLADAHPTEQPDPIGPVTLPRRSKVGKRALALVGTTSMAALAVHHVIDGSSTWTTISNPQ